MKEVALFGGSFDPPTVGHLRQIELLLRRQEEPAFDSVRVVPCAKEARKDKRIYADDAARLAMLRLSVDEFFDAALAARILIDDVEIQRGRFIPTAEMIELLRQRYPDQRHHVVIGEDQSCNVGNWVSGEKLRTECAFVVLPRKGHCADETNPRHVRIYTKLHADPAAFVEVSSTQCRNIIASGGQPDASLITRSALEFISKNGLYQLATPPA